MKMNRQDSILACMFALGFCQELAFGAVSIGGYAPWNTGSGRSIALAGATIADQKNPSAPLENQASIGFQPNLVSGVFDYGTPKDQTLLVPGTLHSDEHYFVAGTSILLAKRIGLGLGLQQVSFSAENQISATKNYRFTDSVLEVDLATAIRLSERIALSYGIIGVSSKRELRSSYATESYYSASVVDGVAYKYGAIFAISSVLALGITHREHTTLSLSQPNEADPLFSSSYQPRVTQLGISFNPFESKEKQKNDQLSLLKISAQIDRIDFSRTPNGGQIYYAPAVVFEQTEAFQLSTARKWIPRIGVEGAPIRFEYFTLIGRCGAYLEPKYLRSETPRLHKTAGVLIRVGAIIVQGAVDTASNYLNQNYGMGIDLGL